jgi:hypothetical protein
VRSPRSPPASSWPRGRWSSPRSPRTPLRCPAFTRRCGHRRRASGASSSACTTSTAASTSSRRSAASSETWGNSLILAIVGVSLLTAILGRRPDPVGAVVHGAAYGVAVEAILINGIVNTQKIQTLYSSTPHWSWWVGHGIFRRDAGPALQRAAGEARGAEHHEAQLTVNHRYDAALRPASGGRPNDKEKQCTF